MVAFIYLARALGPVGYGNIEFTIGLLLFFGLVVDFGSSPYGAREIAKDPTRISEIASSIICLRALLAIAAYSALALLANWLSRGNASFHSLILIYGLTLFAGPGLLEFVFQGMEKMKWVAAVSMVRQFVFAAGVFLFVRRADQVWVAGVVGCASVIAVVVYNITMLKRGVGSISVQWSWKAMMHSFSRAFPLGLSELTWYAIWYSAPILLGVMGDQHHVGIFGASNRPVLTLGTFVGLYFYNLLPSLSRHSVEASESVRKLITQSLKITSWCGVFVAVAGLMLSRYLMLWIFGKNYAASAVPFEILIWCVPIALISGHYRSSLIAFNHQKYEFFSAVGGAIASLLLSCLLIPRYAEIGSAVAILSAVLINGVLAYYFARSRIADLPSVWPSVQPVAAGGLILVGFFLLQSVNFLFAFACGISVFLVLLLIFNPQIRHFRFTFRPAAE